MEACILGLRRCEERDNDTDHAENISRHSDNLVIGNILRIKIRCVIGRIRNLNRLLVLGRLILRGGLLVLGGRLLVLGSCLLILRSLLLSRLCYGCAAGTAERSAVRNLITAFLTKSHNSDHPFILCAETRAHNVNTLWKIILLPLRKVKHQR